jgi:hypothetical protein
MKCLGISAFCCGNYVGRDSWCRECDPKQLKEGWTSGNERYAAKHKYMQIDMVIRVLNGYPQKFNKSSESMISEQYTWLIG